MYVFIEYQIQIKMLADDGSISTFSIAVTALNTIKYVKARISDVKSIPPSVQKLMCSGKVLDDNQTLKFYKIKKNDTLYLMVNKG